MKKNKKKVLIFGATSEMAVNLINLLLKDDSEIYTVSRKDMPIKSPLIKSYIADLSKENEINKVFNFIAGEKFDSIVCFQGVAISSPIEFLEREELQKQLDISLFSILAVLKNAKSALKENGTIINLSSMASFGLFPFLAPYSISKSSSDMLLSLFEAETGIKTISIKPGVVGTKFWKYSVSENEKNFEKFQKEYAEIGQFLKENALKNSNKGISPLKVAKLIYSILYKKNSKASYLVGCDSFLTKLASIFRGRSLTKIIREVLKNRVARFNNAK